jgi:hypothetical protein
MRPACLQVKNKYVYNALVLAFCKIACFKGFREDDEAPSVEHQPDQGFIDYCEKFLEHVRGPWSSACTISLAGRAHATPLCVPHKQVLGQADLSPFPPLHAHIPTQLLRVMTVSRSFKQLMAARPLIPVLQRLGDLPPGVSARHNTGLSAAVLHSLPHHMHTHIHAFLPSSLVSTNQPGLLSISP